MSEETRSLAEPLLDASEAARLPKVPRSTVYELVRSRGLPHVRVGRTLRFTRHDLGRWIDANTYGGRREAINVRSELAAWIAS